MAAATHELSIESEDLARRIQECRQIIERVHARLAAPLALKLLDAVPGFADLVRGSAESGEVFTVHCAPASATGKFSVASLEPSERFLRLHAALVALDGELTDLIARHSRDLTAPLAPASPEQAFT